MLGRMKSKTEVTRPILSVGQKLKNRMESDQIKRRSNDTYSRQTRIYPRSAHFALLPIIGPGVSGSSRTERAKSLPKQV